jgi:hypothetical protein
LQGDAKSISGVQRHFGGRVFSIGNQMFPAFWQALTGATCKMAFTGVNCFK